MGWYSEGGWGGVMWDGTVRGRGGTGAVFL